MGSQREKSYTLDELKGMAEVLGGFQTKHTPASVVLGGGLPVLDRIAIHAQ